MAKTVGYPCAIATKMVLDGEIQKRGMVTRQEKTLNIFVLSNISQVLPFSQDIYKPMLTRLKSEGISATEKSTFLN